ncbi:MULTISPECIES: N-acetylmuramoyl-L-alanine amidase [Clostridium]|uniref:N-acetylmuramoyl-L-alanine amidase n=1 Tax=Clostridium cibarium TaxID=2762247 RepID=A0ABR8PYP5_9CLOT|nr:MULTISPECIES: N-acetylmuramoyl-L-alanine amidase [Clostridium]MBD7913289.1 N-acetylmuramoyl-L-alanine amidase [Clostridium cibarium]
MRVKRVVILLLAILMIFPIRISAQEDNVKGIILIDAGHGGIDGGAKGKEGTIEKNINLSISKKLKKKLEDEGYKVFMTREEDNSLASGKAKDLSARCKMKKETKCDMFISIHQNKFSKESCYGAQVWYASNEKSSQLAKLIQESLKENVDDKNHRIAKAAKDQYKILRDGYDGACIIVECGFLSNYKEEKKLKTDEHQDKIVSGIVCGVNKYFQEKK